MFYESAVQPDGSITEYCRVTGDLAEVGEWRWQYRALEARGWRQKRRAPLRVGRHVSGGAVLSRLRLLVAAGRSAKKMEYDAEVVRSAFE